MFVACSTLCFGKYPLERALQIIRELEFAKIDVAIHEQGPHLKPSEVAADVNRCAQRIRIGTCLCPAAFSVEIHADNEEGYTQHFRAVCRLARLSTVPVISIPAAPSGSNLDVEAERLGKLVQLAEADGVILTVDTRVGTLTELPAGAVELCQRVPGLGLTLDPSHYIIGPNQNKSHDQVFPYVRHCRLRDTGRGPEQFQVRVGQGELEYGRVVNQLLRSHYDRGLTVDIRDVPDSPFVMEPEVRKLKYLLESLV
ncbi:MAG: sugar phosphate isomerase/epimerase [Planctomycetia bacterium]|nr:sugar phosphate isomerase/epimerase [Planctomycetia bacterium]